MEKTQSISSQLSKTERDSDFRGTHARSRFDLMANILAMTRKECRQTEIMHGCNLSFRQIKIYLSLLLDKRLLAVREVKQGANSMKLFKTTRKGETFIKAYERLLDTIRQS